ncbi:carboxypeptidase-like regulatory domain-containing protein [Sphingobacterium sp. KU25419]|nr:carboxypeptidase-like regulatory domain-containing protein [Sphingobacterium sp. KU25419]
MLAQVTNITGAVRDEKGGTLPGITVSEKGTNNQAATSNDGVFSLKIQKLPTTLIIRGIGFKSKEQQIQTDKGINIVLVSDNSALDEVVVVGYQRQSAKKINWCCTGYFWENYRRSPCSKFRKLLQGRVAGVNIQNFTGEPGARNTFTVRGNSTISPDLNAEVDLANTMSSPLYIIDGMPLSVTDLANSGATGTNYVAGINVNDIESIVIQKDAAGTAVWGSRGANGVIVITTKRGRLGKPQARVSYYKGVTERPQLQRTLGGSAERRAKMDILSQYANWTQMKSFNQPLTDSLNPSYNNATDWQDLFYTTGNIDNADASISGGNESVNYRLSAGYYNEDGVVRNTGFKRYSLRGNFGFTISPIIKSDFMISTARINRKRGLGRGIDEVVPINQGAMPSSFVGLGQSDYDFYYGQFDKLKDDNQTDNINIFSKTYVDIIKGLQYSLEASAQVNMDKRTQFQPKELNNGVNYAASNGRNAYTYNLANVLNYNKTFNEKHNIILTAMQSFQYDKQLTDNITAYNLPTDDIKVIQGVAQKDLTASSNILEAGLLSYLAQVSYDYKSKYIINASWRADASSRLVKIPNGAIFQQFLELG